MRASAGLVLVAALAVAGCSTTTGGGNVDTGATDVANDASTDPSADASPNDASPDARPDVATDVPADSSSACDVGSADGEHVVATTRGLVRGAAADGAVAWLGVPFAAPPVGPLRWQSPRPAACWDGIRAADAFGAVCPQLADDGPDRGQPIGDEDCLTLNIWAPEDASPDPLPVLVFIHGGGHVQGASSERIGTSDAAIYDGRRLAADGPVVVVTFNYRLGALGYLAHPAMPDGTVGNWGTLDQVAALEWVRDNIAAFGGDPERVLVFGESAGAVSTCVHVASPLSAGLFDAALMQSGACTATSRDAALERGADRVAETSCADAADPVACMRAWSAADVLAALPGSVALASVTLGASDEAWGPTVDGVVLTDAPGRVIDAGEHNRVPFAVGANSEELADAFAAYPVATDAALEGIIRTAFGGFGASVVDRLIAAYPSSDYEGDPRAALVGLFSDMRFVCTARDAAERMASAQEEPVFHYHFRRRAALQDGERSASHGIELLYVFGTMSDIPFFRPASDDVALGEAMASYWRHLAGSADRPEPSWPEYDAGARRTLVLDAPVEVAEDVRGAQCDLWSELYDLVGF